MVARLRDAILADTRSNQPVATAVAIGTLYFVTDEDVLERSDGADWAEVAINTDAHAAIDHTGITGVGGGGTGPPRDWVGTLRPFEVNSAATDVGLANRHTFVAFHVNAALTAAKAYFRVATQSGNMDIGIYDSSLTRLTSVGSTAVPATGSQSLTFSSPQALSVGTLYYIAYSMSTTAAKFYGRVGGVTPIVTNDTLHAYFNDSDNTLDAGPVTPTGYDPSLVVVGIFLSAT